MALSTNLARLRARIKKEQEKLAETPQKAAESTPTRAAPIQRGPAGQPSEAGPDPIAIIKQAIGAARQGVKGAGAIQKAFQNAREFSLPSIPADVAAAMPAPGLGGSGFGFGRLSPDTQFSLATPNELLAPPAVSAAQGLGPDPSQIFGDIDFGGAQATPTSFTGDLSTAATPTGQALGNLSGSQMLSGGLSSALGILNLIQSMKGGQGGVPSTLGALSGLSGLSSGLGMVGVPGAGAFGGALGGLTGAGNLARGIQSGDPLQIGSGALGLYSSIVPILNQLGVTSLPTLGSLGSSALSGLSGLFSGGAGAAGAGAGAAGAGAAGAGAAGGAAGAAGGGAGAGAGAAAGLGAASTIGIGAAAAMAPLLIGSMVEGWDPIGEAFSKSMGDYHKFVPELMRNVGQQGTAFGTLGSALPYVQSKSELGQLLNTYRNYLETTQKAPTEQFGSIPGAPGDIYSIAKIPGVGPVTHGQQTPSVDFGPQTRGLMQLTEALYGALPGEPIAARYGEPGGGLEGPDAMRLWSQFMDREKNAPVYVPQSSPEEFVPTEGGTYWQPTEPGGTPQPGVLQPGVTKGFYGPQDFTTYFKPPTQISYGQQGYDYAGSGFPEPGKFVGDFSPAWQQLLSRASDQGQARPTAPTGVPFAGVGVAPQGSAGFASLKGPSTELLTAEDPNRL